MVAKLLTTRTGPVLKRSGTTLPFKALLGVVFFAAIGIISLFGVLASEEEIHVMAGFIGTEDPRLARIV